MPGARKIDITNAMANAMLIVIAITKREDPRKTETEGRGNWAFRSLILLGEAYVFCGVVGRLRYHFPFYRVNVLTKIAVFCYDNNDPGYMKTGQGARLLKLSANT